MRDGDHVRGRFTRMGITFVEIDGTRRRVPPTPDPAPDRLLLQVPARPDGKGFDSRSVARLLPPRRDDALGASGRRRGHAARIAVRSGGRPAGARVVRIELAERSSSQRGEIVRRFPASGCGRSSTSATTTSPSVGATDVMLRRPRGSGRRRHRRRRRARAGDGRAVRAEGMQVVLADVQAPCSTRTVAELRAEGLDVTGVVTDVARLRVGRARCATPARRCTARSTSCATTPASAPAPRDGCGSTS